MRLETDIAATPEEVFDLYVDPDRRAEWNPVARSVTIQAGAINEPGSRYAVDTPYGQLIVDVLEVDRPRLYRLREGSGWMATESTMRFEALPEHGCRLVVDVTVIRSRPIDRLLAPIMEAAARWWGRGELRRLKAVAERPR